MQQLKLIKSTNKHFKFGMWFAPFAVTALTSVALYAKGADIQQQLQCPDLSGQYACKSTLYPHITEATFTISQTAEAITFNNDEFPLTTEFNGKKMGARTRFECNLEQQTLVQFTKYLYMNENVTYQMLPDKSLKISFSVDGEVKVCHPVVENIPPVEPISLEDANKIVKEALVNAEVSENRMYCLRTKDIAKKTDCRVHTFFVDKNTKQALDLFKLTFMTADRQDGQSSYLIPAVPGSKVYHKVEDINFDAKKMISNISDSVEVSFLQDAARTNFNITRMKAPVLGTQNYRIVNLEATDTTVKMYGKEFQAEGDVFVKDVAPVYYDLVDVVDVVDSNIK